MSRSKKKNGVTQPRSDWVYGQINHPTSSISVTYSPNGTVRVNEADPASIRLVRSYERSSGKDKFVLVVPSGSPDVSLLASDALHQFHKFIAIDTGTKVIDGRTISATVAYGVNAYANNEVISPLSAFLLFDVDAKVNPEKIGWHLALSGVNPNYFHSQRKLGIVVDSALQEHQDINARKIGYYEDHYLPAFASLIYASDASTDSIPNQMIRLCNAQATKVLARLTPDSIKQVALEKGDKNFAGYAIIRIRTEAPQPLSSR